MARGGPAAALGDGREFTPAHAQHARQWPAMDIGVAGVWLALAQRDEFLSVIAQNNGDIKALTAHLRSRRLP